MNRTRIPVAAPLDAGSYLGAFFVLAMFTCLGLTLWLGAPAVGAWIASMF
jgi:hypothetical protein